MEQASALKMTEGKLSLINDRITTLHAKLEDLLFRAQRIAANEKNKIKSNDSMFGYDLQNFRKEIRTFSHEIGALPNLIGGIERAAFFEEVSIRPAQAVMRIADRVSKALRTLHDHACLAHSHIREADHKIEAWYLIQEVEQMSQKAQSLPTVANKVVIKISTPLNPTGTPVNPASTAVIPPK
jgi:hypothetical protein